MHDVNGFVCLYLGGFVTEAPEQQGDNMDGSSPHLCFLLCPYQSSETGAQLNNTQARHITAMEICNNRSLDGNRNITSMHPVTVGAFAIMFNDVHPFT